MTSKSREVTLWLAILTMALSASAVFAESEVAAEPAVTRTALYYHQASWNGVELDKAGMPQGGGVPSFANVSNYSRGINGLWIDMRGLPTYGAISAADFSFRVGNNADLNTWTAAPAPASVTVLRGEGLNGASRVQIIWPDNAIKQTWLEVTVKANQNTLLPADYTFYFGSAIGEVGGAGNTPARLVTSATDQIAIRNHIGQDPSEANRVFDINRDGQINNDDEVLARNNWTNAFTGLKLFGF